MPSKVFLQTAHNQYEGSGEEALLNFCVDHPKDGAPSHSPWMEVIGTKRFGITVKCGENILPFAEIES